MPKNFQDPTPRQPRSIQSDPAFRAAAEAFSPRGEISQSQAVSAPQSAKMEENVMVQEPGPSSSERTAAVSTSSRSISPVPPAPTGVNKMTIYPSDTARQRLLRFRFEYRIAESIVAEYALERLFATSSDDEIVQALRSQGHGLRRAKPA